jgi:hypothetical protein
MSKLSEIKSSKTRSYWTPASTPIVAPAPFEPSSIYGGITLSNNDYTATGLGGYVFTGQNLQHDATIRGHVVTMDITNILDSEGLYIGSINADGVISATDSHIFMLVWNAGNGNFDVMGGNQIGDAPIPLGSMSYTNGQELAFGTSWDGVDGYLALYLDGVLQYSMNPAVPMTDAMVSFGVYHATSTTIVSTIVETPAFPVLAITQYTASIAGPIAYPTNPSGKIFEVEGVAPGGIIVDGHNLKNGMWVEFDQNEDIVPPLEPEIPYLTEVSADLLYSPLITHFYNQVTAPGANDDSTSIGAMVGSKWQDVSPLPMSPAEWYICSDNTPTAAEWEQLTLTTDELGSMAVATAGSGPTEYRDNAAQDTAISTALSTYVEGPVSSTDNFIPLFDSTSGKLIKESLVSFAGDILSKASDFTVQAISGLLTLKGTDINVDSQFGRFYSNKLLRRSSGITGWGISNFSAYVGENYNVNTTVTVTLKNTTEGYALAIQHGENICLYVGPFGTVNLVTEGGATVDISTIVGEGIVNITASLQSGGGAIHWLVSVENQVAKEVGQVTTTFSYNSTSPKTIGRTIPANTVVTKVSLKMDTGFTPASGGSITIGFIGSPSELTTSGETNVESTSIQVLDKMVDWYGNEPKVFITPGTSVQGTGRIIVEYIAIN